MIENVEVVDIRFTAWARTCAAMGPWAKRHRRGGGATLGTPKTTEFLPYVTDLIITGTALKDHVLGFREPRRALALEHMRKYFLAVGVKKFGKGGNV
jgi:hypothetical protein